jgi:hypothetical protein
LEYTSKFFIEECTIFWFCISTTIAKAILQTKHNNNF